jgi:hypothetical protein
MSKSADRGAFEDILKQFPGPVILQPSGKKWVGVSFLGASMMVIGAASIVYGSSLMGAIGVILCGACTVFAIAVILPGSCSLRLDREGFICTLLYRARRYRWHDVDAFAIWTGRGVSTVVFEVASPRLTVLQKINEAMVGRPGYLSDTYGLTAGLLVQLLSEWRNLAIKEIS